MKTFREILEGKLNKDVHFHAFQVSDDLPNLGQMLGQIEQKHFQKGCPPHYKSQKKTRIRVPHKLNDDQIKALMQFHRWGADLCHGYDHYELKQAFRKLALRLHPDHNKGQTHDFLLLKKHYENLSTALSPTK